MFNIYGGHTKFTQWTQGYKLLMNELPVGADVQFFQDPNEDDPIITEVYEFVAEDGSVNKVCDVPNILVTDTRRIKVYVDDTVYGPQGTAFKVIGNRTRYFDVEPAEKPADYVYIETETKGCGCDGADVSDAQIEAAVEKYMEENGTGLGSNFFLEFVD